MTDRKHRESRPATMQSDATNRSDAKILVSDYPGLYYSSSGTSETIVFDKEIARGIFTPSIPVSDALAEDYRNARGSLGADVWGTLQKEMTQADIDGLQPDDVETIDREMRRITAHDAAEKTFVVARVPKTPIQPHTLPSDVRAALGRALAKKPSASFIAEVEWALGNYLDDRGQVSNATPKKVQGRIANVREQIEALIKAISELEITDAGFIGRAAERERYKGRHTITSQQIEGLLALYHRHVAEAEAYVKRNSNLKGRPQGYAEEAFARLILRALEGETGNRQATTRARKREGRTADFSEDVTSRGSAFTQVLKILLNSVPPGSLKPRRDVEALARRAVRSPYFGGG